MGERENEKIEDQDMKQKSRKEKEHRCYLAKRSALHQGTPGQRQNLQL